MNRFDKRTIRTWMASVPFVDRNWKNISEYIENYPINETDCESETNENMVTEIEKLKTEVEFLRDKERTAYRDGMIDGLKYAIRCNGVSGGEVQ